MPRFTRTLPRILIGLMGLLLILSACSPAIPADDFGYAATPFSASVRGTYTPSDGSPRPIAATVSWGAPAPEGEQTHRPVTMTFTQPPALEGASVKAVWTMRSPRLW